MINHLSLAREARILGLRLEFGLVGLEEIEHWADAHLLKQAVLSDQLMDLAIAKQRGLPATLGALLSLGGPVSSPKDVLAAVSDVSPEQLSQQHLATLVESIAAWAAKFESEDTAESRLLWIGYGLSDDLALRKSGVFSQEQVSQRLSDFFNEARAFASVEGVRS